jgi:hypothetical protein
MVCTILSSSTATPKTPCLLFRIVGRLWPSNQKGQSVVHRFTDIFRRRKYTNLKVANIGTKYTRNAAGTNTATTFLTQKASSVPPSIPPTDTASSTFLTDAASSKSSTKTTASTSPTSPTGASSSTSPTGTTSSTSSTRTTSSTSPTGAASSTSPTGAASSTSSTSSTETASLLNIPYPAASSPTSTLTITTSSYNPGPTG